eukprot:NODE_153_length_1970_cov_199.856845_g113_i0.p1 GENE.NODE_153_length_1970_cov_199.856845_g113_i0~~NODE_153_length_1970_cov_199.856845_g113_i0.p1  ORF type:complete len:582 (+),score=185.65 NODE_153_length_1970_cov_199.856845_g113_i0:32-1777(+)
MGSKGRVKAKMNFGGVPANIILLREGTDTSQGKPQLLSNITACLSVVDSVRSTLGPRGMDKLIHTAKEATISNDGATIIQLLDIEHPAARTLVDIAKSQDSEVGDGTTSVVVLAGEFLRAAKGFVEDGVHPQAIIRAFRKACNLAQEKLEQLSTRPPPSEQRTMLERCAKTALYSKLIASQSDFFSKVAVDAILRLDEDRDLDLVGIKKVPGGSAVESFLVDGVAFKKTFSYAGFEMQPKSYKTPKILLLNVELELKAERDNAEIRLKDPSQYQSIVDAEWEIIYDKLAKCVQVGANIVLSRLPIGDLATQYFADHDIFCAGRVAEEDIKRVIKATGARLLSTCNNLTAEILGTCLTFEERQIGSERYNLFLGCPKAQTATIVLRGGAEQCIEETHRSLHDAMMIVKRAIVNSTVVPGGGAIEMELSKYLRGLSRTIKGKEQMLVNGYAKALEIIPRQVAENAGFDSTDILNRLRAKHHQSEEGKNFGVDINQEGICDTFASYVWEPTLVKRNALYAATEACCLILSIDETVRNPKSEGNPADNQPVGGMGRGNMAMSRAGMAGMARGARGARHYRGRGGR